MCFTKALPIIYFFSQLLSKSLPLVLQMPLAPQLFLRVSSEHLALGKQRLAHAAAEGQHIPPSCLSCWAPASAVQVVTYWGRHPSHCGGSRLCCLGVILRNFLPVFQNDFKDLTYSSGAIERRYNNKEFQSRSHLDTNYIIKCDF